MSTDVIDPDNNESVWGVSPAVFRSMVVLHCTMKFRDVFGSLTTDQIDWISPRLMDGFYSFTFTDMLESIGVERMNERIQDLIDRYNRVHTEGETK